MNKFYKVALTVALFAVFTLPTYAAKPEEQKGNAKANTDGVLTKVMEQVKKATKERPVTKLWFYEEADATEYDYKNDIWGRATLNHKKSVVTYTGRNHTPNAVYTLLNSEGMELGTGIANERGLVKIKGDMPEGYDPLNLGDFTVTGDDGKTLTSTIDRLKAEKVKKPVTKLWFYNDPMATSYDYENDIWGNATLNNKKETINYVGHNHTPEVSYTLWYAGQEVGTGTANEYGDVKIKGTMPEGYDPMNLGVFTVNNGEDGVTSTVTRIKAMEVENEEDM